MELYHSTKNKEQILADGKIKIKKNNFNYNRYLEHMLTFIFEMKEPSQLVGSYPNSRRSAPFMGHGLYCFDNKEQASEFQSEAQILCVSCPDDIDIVDFDDAHVLLEVYLLLEKIGESITERIANKDAVNGWQALLELLKAAITEEFEHSQPAVGLIFYVLDYFKEFGVPDLLIRSFYVKIGVREGDTDNTQRYYLIKSVDKISNLC